MTDIVYFDYAATAPLCSEAAEAMGPYLVPGVANLVAGANANTLYTCGRDAFAAMERARKAVSAALGSGRPDELVFTSGATESNNAAIAGIAYGAAAKRHLVPGGQRRPLVVIGGLEHPSVYEPARRLKRLGCDLIELDHGRDGLVVPESYRRALEQQPVLVSIQTANSEIGVLNDITALCSQAHAAGALFHTDATQAFGKVAVDVRAMGVDAMSVSGHKIGAPKGIGALYLKARTPFDTQMGGGGQESGRRSGTQNVAGQVAFARACTAAVGMQADECRRLTQMRVDLAKRLVDIEGVQLTRPYDDAEAALLPNLVHCTVKGWESETLILRLDALGYCVSGGSACSSSDLKASPALTAIGMDPRRALCSLRLSMGRYTQPRDIEGLVAALASVTGASNDGGAMVR